MHALLIGTGGSNGWPEDGCRCASCIRASSGGLTRRPGRVLVDGTLEFTPYQHIMTGTGQSGGPAHHVAKLPGGFDITGPDGGRLLLAAGPGEIPEPPLGALPYDIALLDLLADPAQLGRLRATGLVREHTTVAALYADHRISSEQELSRRCELWRAAASQDGQLVSSLAPGVPEVIPAPGNAAAGPHRTLIIGGARSGKSTEAELRLAAEPSVTYLAAGPWPAAPDESGTAKSGTAKSGTAKSDRAPGLSRSATQAAQAQTTAAHVAASIAADPGLARQPHGAPARVRTGPDGEPGAEWPDVEWLTSNGRARRQAPGSATAMVADHREPGHRRVASS